MNHSTQAARGSTINKDAAKKPKLGQNFLVSPAAQAAIADALGDVSRRTVVEIGPGRGAITALLASRARTAGGHRAGSQPGRQPARPVCESSIVEILEQNILATDFAALRGADEEKLLIVGNLPYYITSEILLRLFRFHASIERAVVMIQREVAAAWPRIPARVITASYRRPRSCTLTSNHF